LHGIPVVQGGRQGKKSKTGGDVPRQKGGGGGEKHEKKGLKRTFCDQTTNKKKYERKQKKLQGGNKRGLTEKGEGRKGPHGSFERKRHGEKKKTRHYKFRGRHTGQGLKLKIKQRGMN